MLAIERILLVTCSGLTPPFHTSHVSLRQVLGDVHQNCCRYCPFGWPGVVEQVLLRTVHVPFPIGQQTIRTHQTDHDLDHRDHVDPIFAVMRRLMLCKSRILQTPPDKHVRKSRIVSHPANTT